MSARSWRSGPWHRSGRSRVKGSDGTLIPGYLTLPAGSTGKNLPAVVLPHGGPSARDEWGFDWLAQFLAARGYAVLQPNYRGSAGFGDAWLVENGFKSWKTSIGDITASAKWLASEGIADPNRIAVVGWSYGGYAALQSAVVEPQLYKAVVAIAPVTDLGMLKREYDEYTNARLVADFIGSGPHIEQGSPLRNASKIKVPVLLVHGDIDQNVGVAQSAEMDAGAQAATERRCSSFGTRTSITSSTIRGSQGDADRHRHLARADDRPVNEKGRPHEDRPVCSN